MSDQSKRQEQSQIIPHEQIQTLRLKPESIPTANLLSTDTSDGLKKLMKNDSDIMKAYDLNEENLRNLKQLRKSSFNLIIGTNHQSTIKTMVLRRKRPRASL